MVVSMQSSILKFFNASKKIHWVINVLILFESKLERSCFILSFLAFSVIIIICSTYIGLNFEKEIMSQKLD